LDDAGVISLKFKYEQSHFAIRIAICFSVLALTLLVSGIAADHADHTFTFDNLAVAANFFD